MIAETPTSLYHYPLRYVTPDEKKPGGGAGPALCGTRLGWDTNLPLTTYGMRGHLMEHYCTKCEKIAREQKMNGIELIRSRDANART